MQTAGHCVNSVLEIPSHKNVDAVAVPSLFFHARIEFRGQEVDQPHRSGDASKPLIHRHVYKHEVHKPQHQLSLFRIVLLYNFCAHVQRLDADLAMSSRSDACEKI